MAEVPVGARPVTERRREKARRRREEILRHAAAVFKEKGFHGATLDDISERLLLTKGSLYYYFRNKEEILYHCHDVSLDHVLHCLRTLDRAGVSPAERLEALLREHIRVMIDDLQAASMAIEFTSLSPPLLRKIVAKRDRYEAGLRDLLEAGMARGEFTPGNARLLAFAILGAVNWIARWFSPGGPASAEEIADAFSALFLDGLRARPRGPVPARSRAASRRPIPALYAPRRAPVRPGTPGRPVRKPRRST
jgi:AcrR family transcriptional regulator